MRLILGDSAKILKSFEAGCIDLTLTSPPYDDARDYKGYCFDFEKIAKEIYRITKNGGVLVWVVADQTKKFSETLTSFKQAIFFKEECGFNLLDTMIYEKNGGPAPYPNMMRYAPSFEYMFVFSKGKPKTFNPIKDRRNKVFGKVNSGNTARQKDGSTKPSGSYVPKEFSIRPNIWTYDVGKNKDTKDKVAMTHPARFPELLAKDHILSWSNESDVVCDPFMGSGTTGKIAKELSRNFIGVEISEEYLNIAKERIA